MELLDAIKQRQSYRGEFKNEPVELAILKEIVNAGLAAPSGCNQQTTEFVIIREPAKVKALGALLAKPYAQTAPAFIACVVERQPAAVYHDMSFAVEDCAAAVQNILLAICAAGLGSVWLDGVLRCEGLGERVDALISLPPEKTTRVLLPIGYPAATWPRPEKKPFAARVSFDQYGNRSEA